MCLLFSTYHPPPLLTSSSYLQDATLAKSCWELNCTRHDSKPIAFTGKDLNSADVFSARGNRGMSIHLLEFFHHSSGASSHSWDRRSELEIDRGFEFASKGGLALGRVHQNRHRICFHCNRGVIGINVQSIWQFSPCYSSSAR